MNPCPHRSGRDGVLSYRGTSVTPARPLQAAPQFIRCECWGAVRNLSAALLWGMGVGAPRHRPLFTFGPDLTEGRGGPARGTPPKRLDRGLPRPTPAMRFSDA